MQAVSDLAWEAAVVLVEESPDEAELLELGGEPKRP